MLAAFATIAEVEGLAISINGTPISGDAANEIHSVWTLNMVGLPGKTRTLKWRTLRKWSGSRVVYEHHYDHHTQPRNAKRSKGGHYGPTKCYTTSRRTGS